MRSAQRVKTAYMVALAYKSKKKVKTKDGDETTVYEYGPRQVQKRHQDKAKRLEKLKSNIHRLQTQVKKDLKCEDDKKCQTALAVALIDHTYERVGNDESASQGHFGVTGWKVDHIRRSGESFILEYVGKSGVKHSKKVDDPAIVQSLKKAIEGKKSSDVILEVSAEDVNDYLKPYDITAKDLRGYHANNEMKSNLRKERRKGPSDLPRLRKDRDKILKKEFDKALQETAKAVGHEPTTLRGQYLVPSLEEDYLKDGTISSSFV